MKRILFLITERSGSNFFLHLLGKTDAANFPKDSSSFLPAFPEECQIFCNRDGTNVVDDLIRKRPEIDSPEAYVWEPPSVLEPSFYDSLSEDDWKFVYLFREPRSKVQSRTAHTIQIIDPLIDDPRVSESWESVFANECKIVADEMNSVSKMINDPRFLFLELSMLVENPIGTMERVFEFIGLPIDEWILTRRVDEYQDFTKTDRKNISRGWECWLDNDRQIFANLAQDNLVTLGYEKDDSWLLYWPEVKSPIIEEEIIVESEKIIEEMVVQEKPKKRGRKKKNSK